MSAAPSWNYFNGTQHGRTYLGYVRGDRMNEDIKRIGAGEMTYAEFQAK